MFNQRDNASFRLSLKDDCSTYKYDDKDKFLSMFELIRLDATGTADQINMGIQNDQWGCFGNSLEAAVAEMTKVTGVTI